MIRSFACKDTEALFKKQSATRFQSIVRQAKRKLYMLHLAVQLKDLNVPAGNRLELLKGSSSHLYSIRINNQWRLCFRWKENNAYDVSIIDYH